MQFHLFHGFLNKFLVPTCPMKFLPTIGPGCVGIWRSAVPVLRLISLILHKSRDTGHLRSASVDYVRRISWFCPEPSIDVVKYIVINELCRCMNIVTGNSFAMVLLLALSSHCGLSVPIQWGYYIDSWRIHRCYISSCKIHKTKPLTVYISVRINVISRLQQSFSKFSQLKRTSHDPQSSCQVVEGQHRADYTVIQNLELLKVFLKWSYTMSGDSENELLSYILEKILDIITANMLSVMR